MNDQTDAQLLRAYVEQCAEPAFAELVRRHVDLVYSAAVRMVCDSHLAQDVTQGVFVALAKQAHQLVDRPVLSGWLHGTAKNIAAQAVRTDVRRRAREQEAATMSELLAEETDARWEQIAPQLDAALGELNEQDRDALLLRYFERKSAREIAQILGLSDEAAQKRVSRAVERLREFFSQRNVAIGASGLVVLISANAVQSAPVGLAAILATASPTAAITGSLTATKTMTATKLKLAFSAFIIAGAATILVVQHQMQSVLRGQNQLLQQQISQLQADLANYSNQLANVSQAKQLPDEQFSELLKLRGEIGVLRRQLNEKPPAVPDVNALMSDPKTNSLMPQVHIKARFIAIPAERAYSFKMNMISMNASSAGDFSGILSRKNLSDILQEFQSFDDIEILAEPEVLTTSGRQTQVRATRRFEIVTNFTLQESNNMASIVPQTETVETGPMLDVKPRILPDGYTIELPAIVSVTDFLGYQPSANAASAYVGDEQEIGGFKTSVLSGTIPAYTKEGQEIRVPTVSPQFRVQQATNSVSVFDNQTLALTLNSDPLPAGATFLEPDGSQSKYQDGKTLVLITATIVDAAGNRVHANTDDLTNTPASTNGQ